jgi:hypothetical protein
MIFLDHNSSPCRLPPPPDSSPAIAPVLTNRSCQDGASSISNGATFAGVHDADDRRDLIAYIATQTRTPPAA